MTDLVKIWSFECDAWWAPNSQGYTNVEADAGLYERKKAEKIVQKANLRGRTKVKIVEVPQGLAQLKELLPCPFCAGRDIRITEHNEPWRSPTGSIFSMCCFNCGATFPNRYKRELLVEAWNRRPEQLNPHPGA